ncbi:MAG: hypothetical protein AB8B69_16145 [Chitinophagales bacterium]
MKISVYIHYAFFFCLLLSLNCVLKGQTNLVKITPITNYEFEIKNVSGYPIEVHIDEHISYRLLPDGWKRIDKKEITKTSVMRLKYTLTDAVTVNNEIIRQMAERKGLDWSKDVVNEFWGALQKEEEVRLRDIAIYYSENTPLETWLEEELEMVERDLRTNAELLAASNGKQNRFFSNFEPISIYSLTVSKEILTPLVNVIWDFPLKKQSLGDFWDRKSSNMTTEIQLSVGLPSEWRWGKSQTFSTFHGFLSIYRPAYSLLPEDDYFYVGDSYVRNASSDVVELQTGDFINLNLNHLSGGIFIRTLFYPKFFFDIGAGYYFHHSARLHFDTTDEDGINVGHLPSGLQFEKVKTKNIADVEMKKMYGMLRLGWNITKTEYKEPVKGFYLVGTVRTFYEPTVVDNDAYEFYYLSDNDLFYVPLSDDSLGGETKDKMRLMWKLGIGLGL